MIIIGSTINPFGKRNRIAHKNLRKDFTVAGDTLDSLQSYLKDRPRFAEYPVFVMYKDSIARRSTDKNSHRADQFVTKKLEITYNVSKTTQKKVIHILYMHVSLREIFPDLFKNVGELNTKNVSFAQFNREDPLIVANKLDLLFNKGVPLTGILAAVEPEVLKMSLDYLMTPAIQNQIEIRLLPN